MSSQPSPEKIARDVRKPIASRLRQRQHGDSRAKDTRQRTKDSKPRPSLPLSTGPRLDHISGWRLLKFKPSGQYTVIFVEDLKARQAGAVQKPRPETISSLPPPSHRAMSSSPGFLGHRQNNDHGEVEGGCHCLSQNKVFRHGLAKPLTRPSEIPSGEFGSSSAAEEHTHGDSAAKSVGLALALAYKSTQGRTKLHARHMLMWIIRKMRKSLAVLRADLRVARVISRLSVGTASENHLGTLQCRPSAEEELDHRQHDQEKIKPEVAFRLSGDVLLMHPPRSACYLLPLSSKKDTSTPMILMHTCRSS